MSLSWFQSVESLLTGTCEGRSTNWATAPRQLLNLFDPVPGHRLQQRRPPEDQAEGHEEEEEGRLQRSDRDQHHDLVIGCLR